MRNILSKTSVKVIAFLLFLILAVATALSSVLAVLVLDYRYTSDSITDPDPLDNPLLNEAIYSSLDDPSRFFYDKLEEFYESAGAGNTDGADVSDAKNSAIPDASDADSGDTPDASEANDADVNTGHVISDSAENSDTSSAPDDQLVSETQEYTTYPSSPVYPDMVYGRPRSEEYYKAENSNIYAQLIDRNGNIIMSTDPELSDFTSYVPVASLAWDAWYPNELADRYVQNRTFSTASTFKDNYRNTLRYQIHDDSDPKYRVIACINTEFTADDALQTADSIWDAVYSRQKVFLPAAILSAILCIILFVFLMMGAGRRPVPEGINAGSEGAKAGKEKAADVEGPAETRLDEGNHSGLDNSPDDGSDNGLDNGSDRGSDNGLQQKSLLNHIKEDGSSKIAFGSRRSKVSGTAAVSRRPDVALRTIDRIPFDLLTLGFLLVFGLALGLNLDMREMFSFSFFDHPLLITSLFSIMIAVAAGVSMLWFMTIATRIKSGTFLRNNAVCFLCRGLWRLAKKICRAIFNGVNAVKSLWFCVIVIAIWAFINFVIEVIFYWDTGVRLPMLILFNGLCIAGLLYLLSQMRRLEQGVKDMSAGDFDTKIDTRGMIGPFRFHGECLNSIGDGMNLAVEERMKSERMKTELITNVSHDIKTPLTSIVNYVDLLKKEELNNPTADGYVEVLDRQASRLRKLIEDLIEASKASTGNINVTKETLNLCEIVRQSIGEYAERFAPNHLNVVANLPEDGVFIRADGRLLWRVLDNLMNNVSKYAMPGSRVYVDIKTSGTDTVLSNSGTTLPNSNTALMIKNISREQLNISDGSELIERFVRGDSARTTEGSGLGLSIAKSLTELMGGKFLLSVDGDLFKVTLILPNAPR